MKINFKTNFQNIKIHIKENLISYGIGIVIFFLIGIFFIFGIKKIINLFGNSKIQENGNPIISVISGENSGAILKDLTDEKNGNNNENTNVENLNENNLLIKEDLPDKFKITLKILENGKFKGQEKEKDVLSLFFEDVEKKIMKNQNVEFSKEEKSNKKLKKVIEIFKNLEYKYKLGKQIKIKKEEIKEMKIKFVFEYFENIIYKTSIEKNVLMYKNLIFSENFYNQSEEIKNYLILEIYQNEKKYNLIIGKQNGEIYIFDEILIDILKSIKKEEFSEEIRWFFFKTLNLLHGGKKINKEGKKIQKEFLENENLIQFISEEFGGFNENFFFLKNTFNENIEGKILKCKNYDYSGIIKKIESGKLMEEIMKCDVKEKFSCNCLFIGESSFMLLNLK